MDNVPSGLGPINRIVPDRLADAAPKLLEACRAQHRAIDTLMALLVIADPKFRPTQNPEIWRATLQGHEAINQASGVA